MTSASVVDHPASGSRAHESETAIVTLAGRPIHAMTERGAIDHILSGLDAERGGWVVTVNLDILRRLCRDAEYLALVQDADLFVADGMPLVWASRVQGTPLPERVAGSNLVSSLTMAAAKRGRSVFLLGGDEGVAEKAAAVLRSRDPDVRIAGVHCPPFGFERDEAEMASIRAKLAAADPDLVYVALGCPKQDRLIRRLRGELPKAWWMGVGISFSFLCGDVRRAPRWMQKLGLEWVHRLLQQPGRLAKRYLMDDLPFAFRLLGGALIRRFTSRASRPEERN